MPEPAPPAECANCGASIPRAARACPECGADERSGWRDNEATRYDGLDLPETAFDEPAARPAPRRSPHPVWLVVGALMLLAMFWTLVFRR
ncbi:MAG: zinc ribbon domain-containing protein [Opitutaceae bacterium]|nr:zinc ribbon domain-containing protein [Opitutaceae bacterium]